MLNLILRIIFCLYKLIGILYYKLYYIIKTELF